MNQYEVKCSICDGIMEPVDATIDDSGAYITYRCKDHPDKEIKLKVED